MKKMLKAAAVLAAILMAFTLGACDDGSSSGSGGGGGGSGSSYLKIEGKKVTAVYLSKLPKDGKIVIPDGVEELDSQWYWDKDAVEDVGLGGLKEDEVYLHVDKVTSISLPASLKSFYSVIPDSWIDWSVQDQVLDIDIIYRGTLADYCKIKMASYNLRIAKGIKVGDVDLKTVDALVIPDGVTEIAEEAFRTLTNIKSVTIPKSVKEIGNYAFGYNDNTIEAVTYKGTLKDWCDITNDSALLKTVSSIKMSDGKDLRTLTEITADDIAGATKIGDDAFRGCGRLESIEIPESVTEIGYYAFEGCTALTSVTFKDTKGWYRAEYKTEQGNYIDGRLIDVTTPTHNASLLRTASSSWCYAYLYKDKAAQ